MNKGKELVKNTIIILLGKISTQFISFFLLPLYTSYLTTGEYGTVDLVITYVTLFVPIITIQLEMAAFRFLVDNRNCEKEKKKIITNILFLILTTIVIFTIIYIFLISFIKIPFKEIIFLTIFVTIFSNMFLQISRGLGKNVSYSIASCITGVTVIILNIIFIVILGFGAKGMLLSVIIANLLCAIFLFTSLRLYKYIDFKNKDKKTIKQLVKYSLPLVPNGVSWWIISVSDRTIITAFLGVAASGLYAVATKFSAILTSLFSVFGLSWTESASLHINDKDRNEFFSKVINKVFRIVSCLCLLLMSGMFIIFPIIINSEFSKAYYQIPLLLIAALFNVLVTLYSAIYIAKKLTKQVAYTSIGAALISIIINTVFINYIGLYASGLAITFAYGSMFIFRHFDVKKYVNIKFDKIKTLKIIAMFVFSTYIYYNKHIVLNIISLIFCILFSLYINYDIVKIIFDFVIKKLRRKPNEKNS